MRGKVASIVLLNKKKEFLLYLRDNKTSIPYPNSWCILGGHLQKNESPEEALIREIKEEIGFNLYGKKIDFIGMLDDMVGNEVFIYKSRINKNIDEIILKEGQKLRYFSFEKMMKIRMPIVLKKFLLENKSKILN